MSWPKQCAAIIPCFNEGPTIKALVTEVLRFVSMVIVVDDGSTDETAALAATAGAYVVRHHDNRGKGAALKTGMRTAADQGFEWALMLDGDGQHWPDDIPAFWQRADDTGATLVVGNRMPQASLIPWLRRFANRWMSRRISRRAQRSLPDTQCGFRLVNTAAWSSVRLETDHFEIESEMLLAFLDAGQRVEFVPIHVLPPSTRSRIHPLVDTWRWWRWWRRAGRKRAKPHGI